VKFHEADQPSSRIGIVISQVVGFSPVISQSRGCGGANLTDPLHPAPKGFFPGACGGVWTRRQAGGSNVQPAGLALGQKIDPQDNKEYGV